ncbi:mucin-2 isoform X2 [Engraulis encrasicolus]|uniref:mucin-2 isoform X2 n=1 Tax=Engraulis encrasicolus TaxID=184585 RepID=UPI002FD4EB26
MIDLSHLTEEEQEKILAVLKRDADLKKRDTMRVKELHKTVRDKNRLKYLTGDWFYETKSRRHNDKIHGCDIIRASIRQRRPVTIFELSKLWAEKAGTTDSTSAPEESQRNPASTPENQSDGPRPAPQSKQRQNPFNNTPASPVFRGEGGSRRLSNGKAHAGTAPVGELLPSPESPIATLTNQSSESSEHSQGSPNPPRPVPRKRLLHVSPNSSVDNNEPAFKPSTVPSPKSILKQSPRSSPIRSPIRSPIGSSLVPLSLPRCPSAEPSQTSLDLPESPCSGSGTLDKKQVQFSGSVRGRNAARRRSSQDSVENDFLDGDVLVASDDEGSDSSSSSSSEEEEEVDVSSEAHSTSREDSPIFLDPPPRNDSRLSIYSQSSSDSSRVSNSRPVNGGVVVITGYHDNVAETPASKVPSRYATWTDTGKSSEQQPGPLSPKLTEVESYSFTKVLDWFRRNAGRYRRPRKRSRGDTIKVVEESACGTESKSSEETASSESRRASNTLPKTRRGLLSFFLRGHAIEPETTDTISPDTKEPEYVNTTSPDGKEPNTPDTTSIDAKEPNTPKTSSPDANEPETPTTTSLDTKELNTSKTTSPVAKDPDTAKTSSPDGNGPEIPTTTSLDSKELNTHRTTSRVVKESDTIDTTTPDAKEPDTPKTTSPAKDVESPSSEEGTIGQDVTLAQNECVATSTVEEIASHQPEEPEPSISDINSDSQSTLCNAIESCEEREQASSPELRSVCEAEHQDPIAPQSPEGTQDPPSQEDDFSDDQGYVVKAERVVVLEECDTSSEASSLKDMGTHAQGMTDYPSEKSDEDFVQHTRLKHGRLHLSVEPSYEGEVSSPESTSSMTTDSQSVSQATDSSDVQQELSSPIPPLALSGRHIYTPQLKLSESEQQDKAILVRNLRAMWEEEKRKLNLDVVKAKGDAFLKADKNKTASPRGSRKKLSKSLSGSSELSQKRSTRSRSLQRENATLTVEGARRKSVAEIKIHSQWIAETNQSLTTENIKKQSSLPKTKSLDATNTYHSANTDSDTSSVRSQKKSSMKARIMAHSQAKSLATTPSPPEQRMSRRTLYKTSLDGSPLRTVPIDIGTLDSDAATSEDLSVPSAKFSRTPSPREREFHTESLSERKDKNGAGFQMKKEKSPQSKQKARTEQTQLYETYYTPPQSPPKSARQLARRASSGNYQGSLKISLEVSPVHVRVQKHHGSSSHHVRRSSSGGGRKGSISKHREQDVTMAVEVVQRTKSSGSGDEREQVLVPLCFDRSDIESQAEELSTQEDIMDEASSDSSPSQYTVGSADLGSSRGSTPEPWSHASSACNSQNTTPVRGILKRPASRPMSFSKSMEDITTMPAREERMNSEQKSDHMLSMDNVSAAPPSPCSTLDTDQMKRMSASVPAFLQQEVSGSVMSIYSVDYGNVEVKGTIQFAMNYVEKLGEFHIFVVQCRDLAVAEPKRNRSDPYVKCYLLPDKAKLGKRKTSVKKKTFNPTFNEILRYKIPCEVLRSTILNLSVWHNDNFGRNSFLGEVDVDLNEWSITDTQMKHYLLRPRVVTQPSTEDHRGDLKVAVRFLPKVTQSKRASKSGELQIWVKECRNLPVVRGAIIDPFVKCTVLPDSFKKSRQKTRVAKKTADPVFNHTMVYDGLRPEDLCEICVELTVWDHDRLTNHFLGGCRLGLGTGKSYGTDVDWMDSSSEEAALWSQMMTSQGEWIEDVFPLRMLMMARSMSK